MPKVTPPAPVTLPGGWLNMLNALRIVALKCRVAARTDLFEACALISNSPSAARDAYAQALLRCVREAVETKPVFFQPGTKEISFDEAWLIRALMAAKQGDSDSLTFLIRSRVRADHRRHISFLINGIAAQSTPT
ncbi:hypothetical protein [Roseobacter sp. CCS2]|uniref:hypothetical protein n=1 Tax=Roseobacter sp. CCS2 TaxID=391593 RepID=UPI0012EA1A29|nr:hypothetical protein [Roseobacter sp. CCS2]